MFATAALMIERFGIGDELDLLLDPDAPIGLADYQSCATPGCPSTRPEAVNAFFCDRCVVDRERARDRARKAARKAGRVSDPPDPCCAEYGRQCPGHELLAKMKGSAYVGSAVEDVMLLDVFGPLTEDARTDAAWSKRGKDARLRNLYDNPNRGPYEGSSPGSKEHPRIVPHADPFDRTAPWYAECRMWFMTHEEWWSELGEQPSDGPIP